MKRHKFIINENQYPSGELFLNVSAKEYDKEDERAKNIDNRSGVLISALTVLFVFYLPSMKIRAILSLTNIDVNKIIPQIIFLCLYGFTVISFIIGLIYFILSIDVKVNKRISFEDLSNQSLHKEKKNIVASSLAVKYSQLAKENELSNNKKVKYYSIGLRLLVVTVLLMTISTIMAMIFI